MGSTDRYDSYDCVCGDRVHGLDAEGPHAAEHARRGLDYPPTYSLRPDAQPVGVLAGDYEVDAARLNELVITHPDWTPAQVCSVYLREVRTGVRHEGASPDSKEN